MQTLNLNTGCWLFVEVPEGAPKWMLQKDCCTSADGIRSLLDLDYDIPAGLYETIGYSKSITEDQAAQIVDKHENFINGRSQGILHKDYLQPDDMCEWFAKALPSFRSLLSAHKLTASNYAVLRII